MLEIKKYIQDSHRVSIEWIYGEWIHTHTFPKHQQTNVAWHST